ncbi:MAG: nickel pincer cofactor biosynthesis protein LarB [Nitrospinae bacterium]|nr:nickel pincer cofactor biosynthesis protein LarB [Nitrospinota bacterium]
MNRSSLKKLLEDLYTNKIKPDDAMEALKILPYEDIGFAKIDHHRGIRKGFPEVIYCEGKSPEQVATIAKRILSAGGDLLATRADKSIFEQIKKISPNAEFNELARTIVIKTSEKKERGVGAILVASAGTSDIPVAEEAVITAETLGSSVDRMYDVGVAGIHRLLDKKEELLKARVIVVVAGMDGVLPGVIGGLFDKPIVAVPTSIGYGTGLKGVSALLTMLNSCSSGIATVNIDNGFGAGYLAHKINILGEKEIE